MLKKLRKITFVNLFFRLIFNGLYNTSSKLSHFLISRWPVSGVIDIRRVDQDFKMYNACDDDLVSMFYYAQKYDEDSDLILFSTLVKNSKSSLISEPIQVSTQCSAASAKRTAAYTLWSHTRQTLPDSISI